MRGSDSDLGPHCPPSLARRFLKHSAERIVQERCLHWCRFENLEDNIAQLTNIIPRCKIDMRGRRFLNWWIKKTIDTPRLGIKDHPSSACAKLRYSFSVQQIEKKRLRIWALLIWANLAQRERIFKRFWRIERVWFFVLRISKRSLRGGPYFLGWPTWWFKWPC